MGIFSKNPANTIKSISGLIHNKTTQKFTLKRQDKKTSTLKEQIDGNPFFHFNDLKKFVDYRMNIHDKTRETPYQFHKRNHSH